MKLNDESGDANLMRLSPDQINIITGNIRRYLLSISGIGQVLALTIMLETGGIERFRQVGNFASYCRCVGSEKLSNGKKKGRGNTKNGNKYLAWAFIEAANFAIRYYDRAKSFYQRKAAKCNPLVPDGLSHSKRSRINWRGRVTSLCGTTSPLTTRNVLYNRISE